MFAPLYHSATARVAGIRRQLDSHDVQPAWAIEQSSGRAAADHRCVAQGSRGAMAHVLAASERNTRGSCTVKTVWTK